MTSLAQVRDGLAGRLDTIDGLRVTGYSPDDVGGYPAALIFQPTSGDYRDDMDLGSYTVEFIVLLLVKATVDRQQLDLYDLLDRTGSKSIFATIEADRTLGGLAVDARVITFLDPLDRGQMASTQVYQRAVTVSVIVS